MKIVRDELWVCGDCVQVIANDEWSGVQYYCADDEAFAAREAEIKARLAKYGGGWVIGDGEEEFSRRACDCCGDPAHGYRHEAAVLGA